ncbi:hypothetical protein HHI36_005275, partial [Cryptolaemus montrouzieri]
IRDSNNQITGKQDDESETSDVDEANKHNRKTSVTPLLLEGKQTGNVILDEDVFQTVRSKNSKSLVGTRVNDPDKGTNSEFVGRRDRTNKKVWLFIFRVRDGVSSVAITSYIATKTGAFKDEIVVNSIKTSYTRADSCCFQVGVPFKFKTSSM